MSNQVFYRLVGVREAVWMLEYYDYAMDMSDAEFARIDLRLLPCYENLTKEEFCWNHAVRMAAETRSQEEEAIHRGIKRLTPAGELINIPTGEEMGKVDKILGELGL